MNLFGCKTLSCMVFVTTLDGNRSSLAAVVNNVLQSNKPKHMEKNQEDFEMNSPDIYHRKIKKDNDKDKWLMNCFKRNLFLFVFILCKRNVDNNGPSG